MTNPYDHLQAGAETAKANFSEFATISEKLQLIGFANFTKSSDEFFKMPEFRVLKDEMKENISLKNGIGGVFPRIIGGIGLIKTGKASYSMVEVDTGRSIAKKTVGFLLHYYISSSEPEEMEKLRSGKNLDQGLIDRFCDNLSFSVNRTAPYPLKLILKVKDQVVNDEMGNQQIIKDARIEHDIKVGIVRKNLFDGERGRQLDNLLSGEQEERISEAAKGFIDTIRTHLLKNRIAVSLKDVEKLAGITATTQRSR